ncbi:MAG: serine/threonine-protein kinase [Rubripirellula sp.]
MPSFEFLGPYRLGDQLGRGGMGSVYRGVHEKTGEEVAVKLISQHVADEPRFRRRFDAEVKTLQRLRHDGIVRLIGFGEEEGQLFYSMELLDGETLQARIRREKKLSWQSTIDIAIQICSALKHAHDMGVFHRDLKPANLVLVDGDAVKLVDFGIAKIFGHGEQTMAGSVLGTADYMAPEQATSAGITQRTDLYALGSLMYAMVTGRPPFTGKNVTEVIESLKRDRPVPLDLINNDLPDDLVELIHQLLEKNPADRPPTALAVMNRLKAMRAGLQREQTLLKEGAPTEVGPVTGQKGNPLDTSVSQDRNSSSATDVTADPGRGPKKTNVSQGAAAGKGASQKQIDPQQATVASFQQDSKTLRPDDATADDNEDDTKNTKSHFQTVNETTDATGVFEEEASGGPAWGQWVMIAGMLAALMIGGVLFVYAMQPPSADALYETAVKNQELGAMSTFMRRFPEDTRHREVLNLYMSSRLASTLKRLSVQRKLDVTPLELWEEGFLSAMQNREQEPLDSSKQIENWLNVYGSEKGKQVAELVKLATHEMKELKQRAPRILIDRRAQQLIDDIRNTMETETTEVALKKLRGIVELHAAQNWAQPAVEEAKRQIESLEEFADLDKEQGS